ncbi:MAG TPA: peptide-methionine (S)-S-oxide reductase MsrA [Xanthobacteraceae bacterium]|jgi:peptide-methionine (S)-S-oxide reductase|nr:peptide-methionine (S)-S-oxide reductase MsrA [Xanthobacteraceae bacterium]
MTDDPTPSRIFYALAGAVALAFVIVTEPPNAAESAVVIPAPAFDVSVQTEGLQKAILAGGCFWGVQAVFQHVQGVSQAVSGYSGGTSATANYDAVSNGITNHAETVEVTFDPKVISYGRILQIFFSVAHNPTELDQQGPDIGRHYRSNIFYTSDEQKRVAEAYIAQLDRLKVFNDPIVTRLDKFEAFYPAEDDHQDYATRYPDNPYIMLYDLPKIGSLRRLLPDVYRPEPVTVAASAGK